MGVPRTYWHTALDVARCVRVRCCNPIKARFSCFSSTTLRISGWCAHSPLPQAREGEGIGNISLEIDTFIYKA